MKFELKEENKKNIKEEDFLKVLCIKKDSVMDNLDLERYEYLAKNGKYYLYYFKFKTVKEFLAEFEEIKKLDNSREKPYYWYNTEKLMQLLIAKKVLKNIEDTNEFIEENTEFLDDVYNEFFYKFV